MAIAFCVTLLFTVQYKIAIYYARAKGLFVAYGPNGKMFPITVLLLYSMLVSNLCMKAIIPCRVD